MAGEEAQYDVFLSYRVASDSQHVEQLYNLLVAAPYSLRVYWDKVCLKPGEDWEAGFCAGVVNSRTIVLLLSRDAIKYSVCKKDHSCTRTICGHTFANSFSQRFNESIVSGKQCDCC